MTIVSIRPIQGYHIESIGGVQRSMVIGTTSLHVDTIEGTYRLKLELSVGVLVVYGFVDGGRRCRWRIYSYGGDSPTFTTPSQHGNLASIAV